MKKNRTIGKKQVMDAAMGRGLLVRRVKTVEGLRWEVSNGKGLRAFYVTLAEVWSVVRPRPIQLPEEEEVPLQGTEAVTTDNTEEEKSEVGE